MAIKSTIYKANLNVADMDRGYYADHALTIACHPSETEERMMIRVLAFALRAHERLEFGRGISADDEPALWLKEYSGEISEWIEVGQPDERLLRRASGRAARVYLYTYGGRAMEVWWEKEGATISRLENLEVWAITEAQSRALAALAQRSMQLQCTIQDGQVWLNAGEESLLIEPRRLTPVRN